MNSIFGIGIPELLLILIVAGLILGPRQIREVARMLGRVTGKLQGFSGEMRQLARLLSTELDAIEDVRAAKDDLQLLQKQLTSLQRDLNLAKNEFMKTQTETMKGMEKEVKAAVGEGEGDSAEAVASAKTVASS
ncbi:MAG: twin-arginine translocase TatA/TatE family subunit, partial [Methylococcales bacterium]|nr:twin-arginine translocase TatA/TatE family subunit [Methylococcales bacterium]